MLKAKQTFSKGQKAAGNFNLVATFLITFLYNFKKLKSEPRYFLVTKYTSVASYAIFLNIHILNLPKKF